MKNIRSVVISSAFALVLCGMANADVLDVNCSVASGPTELGTATPGTISCQDFNTALGTLTGMTIELEGAVIAPSTINVQNNTDTTQTGSATTASDFNLTTALTGFTFTTTYDPITTNTPIFDVFAATGAQSVLGNSTVDFSVTGSSSQTQTNSGGADLIPYESFGYSLFNVSAATQTGAAYTFSGGNNTVTQATDASFTAVVDYTYSPSSTPEPATMALFGSGLIGLGLIRRKLRKKV